MTNYIRNSFHDFIADKIDKIDLPNWKKSKILDIWCWDAKFLLKLKEKWYSSLYWIDNYYDENYKNSNIIFDKQDINNWLLFENESFDIIFLLDVIEHVPNQFFLFDEIFRILKKDGFLIVSTPNITSIIGKINFLFNDTLHWFWKWQVVDKQLWLPGHINPFIPNIFIDYYSNKFNILNKYYFWIIIPFINKFIKINSKRLSGNLIFIINKEWR